MSKKDDGGPAFPFAGEAGHSLNDSGMTLRDYFAAKAMAALVRVTSNIPVTAADAYAMADAMLAAREAKQ